MRLSVFVVSIAFFMNHVFIVGMQESLNAKVVASIIVKEIGLSRNPLAIACTPTGKLIVLDESDCTFWNYQEKKILNVISTILDPCEERVNKIYVHPKKDISIIPRCRGKGHILFNHEDNSTVCFNRFKNRNSNVLYSDMAGFYVIRDDTCLVYDNTAWPEIFTSDIAPGLLFAILNPKETCFLCCDEQEENVYELYTHQR